MCAYTYIYTHIYIYSRINKCTYRNIYIHKICILIDIYPYKHTHTHTHIHTHIYIVTRPKIFIPRREFIFRTREDGAAWHLIPRRISSS